jgi:hypothetical protein
LSLPVNERPIFPVKLNLVVTDRPGATEEEEFEFRQQLLAEVQTELKGYMCRLHESDTKLSLWFDYVDGACFLNAKACCGEFERCVRMFVREYVDVRIYGKQTS